MAKRVERAEIIERLERIQRKHSEQAEKLREIIRVAKTAETSSEVRRAIDVWHEKSVWRYNPGDMLNGIDDSIFWAQDTNESGDSIPYPL